MDISKLKVADLRKELQSRGLDTKGNKPVLVERLKEAIAKEAEEPEEEDEEEEEESENEASSGGENSLTYETAESANTTVREVTSAASEERAFSVITSAVNAPPNNLADDTDSQLSETNIDETTTSDYTLAKSQSEDVSIPESDEIKETPEEDEVVQSHADQKEQVMPEQDDMSDQQDAPSEYEDKTETPATPERNHFDKEPSPEIVDEQEPPQQVEKVVEEMEDEESSKDTNEVTEVIDERDTSEIQNVSSDTLPYVPSSEASEVTDSPIKDKDDLNESMERDNSTLDDESRTFDDNEETQPLTDKVEKMDTDPTPEISEQSEEAKKPEQDSADNECLWNSDDESSAQPKESSSEAPISDSMPTEEPRKRVRKSRFDQPEERKRKHSPSPSSNDYQSGAHYEGPAKIPKQDDEPSYDQDSVLLSWYDSDLNLVINKENFVGAVPLAEQGFMYMWGGARSTYGFNSGKVYYDVKLLEKCPVNTYDEFEIYSFRLGWSVAYSSLQLGETSLSYGYDSSGKKCTDDKFEEYGQSFSTEDVIGCLLDFESNDENVLISFAVNGTKQEVAFEVPKTELEDKALFPHILSKNISYEVNFGDRIEPWNSDESYRENFEWAAKVPLEQRIQGPKKPEEKTECEVIMMCGLPCSGKTTWVKNHVETHSEKMYNVIGIDFALNKMKVLSEPIQNYYKDAPDMLVEKCSKCVNRLIELASVRWRNYIIDEPNVFAAIQRRKMRDFEGYTRIAIVIIPNEEEYNRMLEKWNDNTLRDTSISLVELKGNFKLPEEGELFNTVSFVGVNKEEAEDIVKKYNKEGRDARPRDDRSYNRGPGGRDHMDRMQSYGRPPMGGFRQRWMDRGPPSSMGRGGWGPRGGMDRMPPGFRDRRNWRDRSPDNGRDGGYRSGGGRYQQRGMPGSRYGNSGPMMGNSRWGGGGGGGGGGRDRDRMAPRSGGPNPLMGSMMGKPGMGYDRKGGRYGSDDGKRREDGDSDEYDRTRGIPPPGIEADNNDEPFDDGADSGGEDGDRKRRSRFSDGDRRGGRGGGGYMGRGGNGGRGGGGGRGGSNGRSGPFPPGKGPRGGGGYNRGRGPEGGNDYYGRRGGPPGRDNRDRNQMGPRQGSSRFDKRDSGGKNDGNSQASQSGWGMYGQGGWNQAAAANYQNWAQQYQGYNAQQMQQYWAQMQQQQQDQSGQQNQHSQQSSSGGQQNSKNSNTGNSSNTSSSATASQSASNSSTQQPSAGYNTQGYNTAGYGTQGYDPNAYAQYYAQYCNQLAQQGWNQNTWAAYGYNYGAMAASAGGVGGLPSTSVPPPSVTGGASGSSTGGSGNQSSAVTSASNK